MIFLQKFLASILMIFHLNGNLPYTQLEKAFSENNAKAIVAYGKEKILLKINGKEGVYSQAQAGLILNDFFESKPAATFVFSFKGKETNDGCFAIGDYKSKSESYKVSIHFQKVSEHYKIESLSIES